MDVDLVIRDGCVVTASDVWPSCDIGIKDGTIVAIGSNLVVRDGTEELHADGAYITPGGVDAHVHLSQFHEAAVDTPTKTVVTNSDILDIEDYPGDKYDTGTASAVAGGTTTVVTFASQLRDDDSIIPVIDEYHKVAKGKSYCDYAFHVIITRPTPSVLTKDLKVMVEEYGITSIKIYMTYESMKLSDHDILDVMYVARKMGITIMVHAENSDMINWMTEHLEARGLTAPYHHGTSRPPIVETEAVNRAISLGELMDTPILLVHVSGSQATKLIRDAQTRLLPVYGETCPHYLFLLADSMRKQGFEGKLKALCAKCVCSPPLREDPADQAAIWQGIKNGTFTILSSDHAPSKYNHAQGKLRGLAHGPESDGRFQHIPNGLPGVETRLPLLFSGGVVTGRITPQRFVELTATNPAKLYGLRNKGTIAPGFDADITIWHRQESFEPFTLTNEKLHHAIDYTPFEGVEFRNWPRYTLVRGKVVFSEGKIVGDMGYGRFVKRESSLLPVLREAQQSEWRL